MLISSDTSDPIYLVSPAGEYVRDDAGNLRIFEGEALEKHPSGYLVDTLGNFLLKNNAYIEVPHNNNQTTTAPLTITPIQNTTLEITPPIYAPNKNTSIYSQQIQHNTQFGDDGKPAKKATFILFVIVLALAIGVGGGLLAYHFLGNSDSTSSDSTDSTQTDNPQARDIIAEEPTTYIHLPAEAYQGAGSAEVPDGALNVSNYHIILSPTHNLGCNIKNDDSMVCLARNWEIDRLYGTAPDCTNTNPDYCTYNGLELTLSGQAHLTVGEINGDAYTVPYGTVVHRGNWVCASEENGLTCWSKHSGHGFFMNRNGYKEF